MNPTWYFPPVDLANPDGLLAIGGDLSPEKLLIAYQSGIFPWYSEGQPILWWSPDPRFILYPAKLRFSRSMKQTFRKNIFTVTYDKAFGKVISLCKRIPRKGQEGTWITPEMQEAYMQLHRLGLAHSVEVWREDRLVGGLYGLALGKCFFGESMFSLESNASKMGFISLVKRLEERKYQLIDCQVYT
ncbi:MAG: leucyl/phenylalanyl-tRNA--protein transferase, partial [Bacteroidota bacterium]